MLTAMLVRQFKKRLIAPVTAGGRPWFVKAAAALSLAVWLFMVAAEICPSLHAWLHGGAVPDNDSCAVALMNHGKLETVICAAPVVVPVIGIEIAPRIEFSVFRPVTVFFSGGRGPPAASSLS
jgi:hypothetical protein